MAAQLPIEQRITVDIHKAAEVVDPLLKQIGIEERFFDLVQQGEYGQDSIFTVWTIDFPDLANPTEYDYPLYVALAKLVNAGLLELPAEEFDIKIWW